MCRAVVVATVGEECVSQSGNLGCRFAELAEGIRVSASVSWGADENGGVAISARDGGVLAGRASGTVVGYVGSSRAATERVAASAERGPRARFDPESESAIAAARAAGLRRGISSSLGSGNGIVVHGINASIISVGV